MLFLERCTTELFEIKNRPATAINIACGWRFFYLGQLSIQGGIREKT